jgi:hypothetical protein
VPGSEARLVSSDGNDVVADLALPPSLFEKIGKQKPAKQSPKSLSDRVVEDLNRGTPKPFVQDGDFQAIMRGLTKNPSLQKSFQEMHDLEMHDLEKNIKEVEGKLEELKRALERDRQMLQMHYRMFTPPLNETEEKKRTTFCEEIRAGEKALKEAEAWLVEHRAKFKRFEPKSI